MSTTNQPRRCPICDYYLTITFKFIGYRCVDPGHWQAEGMLSSRDYFSMAKIAAEASAELKQRPANGHTTAY